MKNGPALWDAILKDMPEGAVIAGGAVRDYLLGIEPKDIDVFAGSIDDLPEGFGPLERDEKADEYEAFTGVDLVLRGERFGYPVDLVILQNYDPETLLETFDTGLSRSMWQDSVLIDTIEAMTDRKTKTVSLLINNRAERSQRRFDRFNERTGGQWNFRHGLT